MLSVPFICALYYQSCHFIVVLSFLPSFLLSFFFFMYSFSSLEITTLTLSASAIQLMQDHSLLDSDIATLETSIILFIPTFNSNLLIFIVNKQSLYWEAIFCPFFLFFFHQAYTLQLRNQRQALLGFVKFLLFRLTHKQDNSARRYVGGIFSKKSWLLFFWKTASEVYGWQFMTRQHPLPDDSSYQLINVRMSIGITERDNRLWPVVKTS